MSIIRRLTETRSSVPPSFVTVGGNMFPSVATTGDHIDEVRACRVAAVTASRRVLTSALVSMTPTAYAVGPKGIKRRRAAQPPIVVDPSATVARRGWVAQVSSGLILAGNVYGRVTAYTPAGFPASVETLPFGAVRFRKDADGVHRPWYRGKEHKLYPVGDIVHQPATSFLMPGSPVAQSPVELATEPVGTAISAEAFLAQYFRDGANPSLIVRAAKDLTGKEARTVKRSINNAMRGNREPAVVGKGYEIDTVDVNVKDAEMVAILRFESEQVARIFGVPPSMIYASISGQAITYQNIGQSDHQFLKHSLRSWMDDIEDLWTSFLPGTDHVLLDPDELLKLDPKSRHELHKLRLDSETTTVDEVREAEGEESIKKETAPADPPIEDPDASEGATT